MSQRLRRFLGGVFFWVLLSHSFAQNTIFFPPQTTNPTCNGSTNGSIVFSFQGDSTEFFFSWSGGNLPTNGTPTSGNGIVRQTGLSAGTYSVFILDLVSGFDTTIQTTLSNPQPIAFNVGNDISNCLGQPINLSATTNAASGSVTVWSYTNANGPQILTGQSVTVPAVPSPQSISATTTVTATLTDPAGCTATDQVLVTVNPLPSGSANPASQTICQGRAIVALTNSQPGGSFIWTVNQVGAIGATSGSGLAINQLVRATGAANGTITYNIRPVSSSGCIGIPFTATVVVKPKPVATASPDSSVICSATQTNISLSASLAGASFAWRATATNVTGASNGTGNLIAQTLNAPTVQGKVVYKVVATVNDCPSDSLRVVVDVKPRPTLTVSPADTINVCAGQVATLTYSSNSAGAVFSWVAGANVVGGVSGTGAINAQTYTNGTGVVQRVTYSVTAIANGCTSQVKNSRVRVRPVPVVTIASERDTVCTGNQVQLSLSSNLPNSAFAWTSSATGATGNTATGTSASISDILSATGQGLGSVTYQATATKESCVGLPVSKTVFVRPLLDAQLAVTPSNPVVCSGNKVKLKFSSPFSGIQYSWTANASGVNGSAAGVGDSLEQMLTLTGNNAGFVDYTITPGSGSCLGLPQTVRVNVFPVPAAPVITVSGGTSPICAGQSLTLTSSQPFGNQWILNSQPILPPAGTAQSLVTGVAGTYRLVFTDGQGCSAVSDSFQIDLIALPLAPVISGPAGFCPGDHAVLTSSEATGNQWNINGIAIAGATGNTFSASAAGSYTVTKTSGICASTSLPFLVTAFSNPPQPTISGNNFLCAGDSGILISSPATAYMWSRNGSPVLGAVNDSLTIKLSGDYRVRITDENGCHATSAIFDVQGIEANPIPTITGVASFCLGSSTILTTDNTNPAWKNQWYRNGQLLTDDTLRTLVVTTPGEYTVTLRSPRGCVSISLPTTVSLRAQPETPVVSGFPLICPGGSNVLSSTAQTGNVWFLGGVQITGANEPTITVTQPGSYTVAVTNAEGCRATSASFLVESTTGIVAEATLANPQTCQGTDGTITTMVTGGSGVYEYVWQPTTGGVVQGQANQTGLRAGNYNVTITDQNSGCGQVIAGMILNDPANFTAIPTVTNVSSCTSSNGSVALVVSGSNGPFTFNWSPVAGNGATLSNLAPGFYAVQITDNATNCSLFLDSIEVGSNLPNKPNIQATNGLEFCAGDSTVLFTTSTGPYQWARLGSGALGGETDSFLVVKTPGEYYVRTSNPSFPNCFSRSDTLVVTVNSLPANPTINSSSTTVCEGISVSFSTTSILANQWLFNGSPITGATGQVLEATDAGQYCLRVTDGNGCSRTSTNCRTVEVNPNPPKPVITGAPGFCPGGSTTLSIAPFDTTLYEYTWMRNNQFIGNQDNSTINASISGWYEVRALNTSTSCRTFSDTVFVEAYTAPEAPTITGSQTFCQGGSTQLTASPGITYQWTFNETVLEGATDSVLTATQAGNYRVAITDANGCIALSAVFVLGEIPAPLASTISGNSGFCAGSSQLLTASPNVNYEWLFNGLPIVGQTNQTVSATLFGNYQVVVVSGGTGCTDTSAAFITSQAASNFLVDTTITDITCIAGQPGNNGSITLSVENGSGNYDYAWTPTLPNSPTQNGLPAGNYSVTVKDNATSCEVTVSNLVVDAPAAFTATSNITQPASCGGSGMIALTTQGGSGLFDFAWSGTGTGIVQSQPLQNGLTAGIYSVTITDTVSKCAQTLSDLVVNEGTGLNIQTVFTSPTTCGGTNGTAAAITGMGGFSYNWKTLPIGTIFSSDSAITGLAGGSYRVMVSNGTCLDSAEVTLVAPTSLVVTAVVDSASGALTNDGAIHLIIPTGITVDSVRWVFVHPDGLFIIDTLNDNFSSDSLIVGLYHIRIYSGNCGDTLKIFVPYQGPQNSFGNIVSPSICGASDGGVLTPPCTGPVPPDAGILRWFDEDGNQIQIECLQNVKAGVYYVLYHPAFSDPIFDRVIIPEGPLPTLTAAIDSASCADTAGSITITSPQDISGYTVSWTKAGDASFSSSSNPLTGLSSGTYTAIFSNGNCVDTLHVLVPRKTCPVPLCSLSVSASVDSASCANNDGAITLTVSNGSASTTFAWTQIGNASFSSASQNLTGLVAGIYQVIATDGLCKDTLQVTVLKPANCGGVCNLQVIASGTPVNCAGGSDGTALAFVVNGGVGPFSYQLNGGPILNLSQFFAAFTNQPAGPFEVVVTDAATSCKDTVQSTIGTIVTLVANAFTTNPSCGFSDGQIRVVVSGGAEPYMVALGSNPPVTAVNGVAVFSGLLPGNYNITVSDGTPCQTTVSNITLSGTAPLAFTYGNVKPATCFGSKDGAIQLATLTGSTVGYTYFVAGVTTGFQAIAAGDSIKNLPAGTHNLILRATGGCEKDTTITIPGAEKLEATVGNIQSSACSDSTGSAKVLSITGGHPGTVSYNLLLNAVSYASGATLPADSILRNLTAGNYQLQLSDVAGCSDTVQFSIGIITVAPAVSITASTTTLCTGDTVIFTATNSAFVDLPSYAWYVNNQPILASGGQIKLGSLQNGDSVQVKITGASECLDPDSAWSNVIHFNVLPSNAEVVAGLEASSVAVCIGSSTKLHAINQNNLPDPGYQWIVNGFVLTNDTTEFLTLFPGQPVNTVRAIVISRSTSTCIAKNRDTSDVVTITQLAPFTAQSVLIQTAPVTGQHICPSTPVTFSVQTNLRASIPIVVQWFRNDTLVATGADTFYTFNGLAQTATIKAVVAFDTAAVCITSNFGKGKDSTNALLINVLPSGDIRCQPCALNATANVSNINCAGGNTGSILVNASGGTGNYKFTLLPNGPVNQAIPIFFGLAPGPYSVVVRDTVTGCTRTISSINIIVQNSYNAVVASTNPTPCIAQPDGKLEFVSITDGSGDLTKYKYRLGAGNYGLSPLFIGLPAGTYLMEAIDTITGCLIQVSRTLVAPAGLQAFASVAGRPTCYGQFNGAIRLDSVKGGFGFYQYSLSGDSGTFAATQLNEPLPQGFGAGSYSIFIRDVQSGCLDTVTLNITQPDSIRLVAATLIQSACSVPTGQMKIQQYEGGSGLLKLEIKYPDATVFLPLTVPADSILINMAGGDYVIMATDTNNCTKQILVTIPTNKPRANLVVTHPCIGDTNGIIRVSGTGGGVGPYNYSLFSMIGEELGNQTDTVFAGLSPGLYLVQITDASAPTCTTAVRTVVQYPQPVRFNLSVLQPSTCENFDGVVRFKPTGGQPGFQYSFDSVAGSFTSYKPVVGDSLTISGLSTRAPGSLYTLRMVDAGPNGGCAYDTTFNVPGNSPLRFRFTTQNVKCFGEHSGAIRIDSLNGTGPVMVRVTDRASGEVIKEDSIAGGIFFNNQFVMGGLPAGEFNFTVVQYGACNASRIADVVLTQPTQIQIEARQYKPTAQGFGLGGVLLDTVRGSVSPYWVSFNEGEVFNYKPDTLFDRLNVGTYTIRVTDSIGCVVSKEVEVMEETTLFVPTLFTPNTDGQNDRFEVRNLPQGSSLKVANRWGKEVYQSDNYQNDWDAKNEEDGTYYWTMDIPGVGTKTGWVQIVR